MDDIFRKIFILSIFLNFSFAQTQTNFEVIDSLLNSIVGEISEQIRSDKIKVETSLQNKVIENRILNSFSKRFALYINDDADAILVRLDAFKSRIKYAPVSRGLFRKFVNRRVEINLYCSVIQDGKVLFSRDFKREHSDYVKDDAIQDLEDESFDFTRGEFIGNTLTIDKLLEVAVLVLSVGISIYLLFAVRK
ncbi:MAG: hypothetical protein RMJ81_09575 [Candidatus Kryptonium sp.]|nr:hypothetical protein [Candidatus Kryptonium sp.]MCX7761757.1 hypothetical protein [Candidatus Kryptonium sp.]MDW8109883.1 hypothetical protein [Candidatus Kryptonium sp.]